MAKSFGDFAVEDTTPDIDEGEHPAQITKAEVVYDPKTNAPLVSYDKHCVDVTFKLQTGDEMRRRYGISFGQNNTNGAWAAFAQLIAAAAGIPCGASNQRKVTPADLEGQPVRVVVKWQEKNGRQYLNVTDVLPPKRGSAQPKPDFTFTATREQQQQSRPKYEEDLEDDLPF